MSIVKSYSKQNDTTYFYEQDYKWNPVTKRPEGTRKLIGKLDPETGKMIPTGKPGRPKKEKKETSSSSGESSDNDLVEKLMDQINELTEKNQELFEENCRMKQLIKDYKKKISIIAKTVESLKSEG